MKFWNFWHITRLSIISRCKVIWSQIQSGFLAHPVVNQYRAIYPEETTYAAIVAHLSIIKSMQASVHKDDPVTVLDLSIEYAY